MADLLTAQSRTRGGSPSLSTRIRSHPALAPALVGLLGLAISLIGIGIPSLWYDEAATVTAVTRDWPELWRMLGNVDAVHGAYYLLMHALVDLFGYSPVLLRMPSAIAVGAAASLTVVLGRQLGLGGGAVVGGLVFCLLPRATWMGTEARSYALSAGLAVLLTIVLLHAQRSNRRRWWLAYAALTVVSCYFFIYLALVIVAHGFSMAWWLASARRTAVATVRRWFVASAAAAVALLPFALAVIGQNAQVSWILDLGPDTPRQVLRTQWFLFDGRFAIAGWILIAFGVIALLRTVRGFSAGAVLLPALVVPTAALLLATELYSPLYTPRYLTMCLPFVALVIGAAIAAVPTRPLAALTLASLVLLAIFKLEIWPDSVEMLELMGYGIGGICALAFVVGFFTATTRPRHPGSSRTPTRTPSRAASMSRSTRQPPRRASCGRRATGSTSRSTGWPAPMWRISSRASGGTGASRQPRPSPASGGVRPMSGTSATPTWCASSATESRSTSGSRLAAATC